MPNQVNLSFLDRREILEIIFPLAYSSLPFFQFSSSLSDDVARSLEVEGDVHISCGFWTASRDLPSILYFHGNGETAGDYGSISKQYTERNINLFVSEYRGYGESDGKPTITNMIRDAHPIFGQFKKILQDEGFIEEYFLMGRSLGSIPAIELALHHQDEICGLIVESGTANNFRSFWKDLEGAQQENIEREFINKIKIKSIHKPTLIIHGENDQIMPVREGKELYENAGAEEKRILTIPGADHNTIMVVGREQYFATIEDFVKAHRQS